MTETKKMTPTKKKKCGTCKHLVRYENDQKEKVRTECRCHPPQVIQASGPEKLRSVWPVVKDEDWCGQWAEGKPHVMPVTKIAGMLRS